METPKAIIEIAQVSVRKGFSGIDNAAKFRKTFPALQPPYPSYNRVYMNGLSSSRPELYGLSFSWSDMVTHDRRYTRLLITGLAENKCLTVDDFTALGFKIVPWARETPVAPSEKSVSFMLLGPSLRSCSYLTGIHLLASTKCAVAMSIVYDGKASCD